MNLAYDMICHHIAPDASVRATTATKYRPFRTASVCNVTHRFRKAACLVDYHAFKVVQSRGPGKPPWALEGSLRLAAPQLSLLPARFPKPMFCG